MEATAVPTLVSADFSLNLFQVFPLHMHATSIHTYRVIGYLTSKCEMYSTNYTWELLRFWFLLKETVSVRLKTGTPHHPSSHTRTHTHIVQSVCSGLVTPVVALEHILRPPTDHVNLLDRGASDEVGISRYEGIEEVGGGLTSKDRQSLSLSLSNLHTHTHTHTHCLTHSTLHLCTFSFECLVGVNETHQSSGCCRFFSFNSHTCT